MVFPPLTWVLLIVSAVLCSVGFYRFVWFMSVGYGLAVAGIGAAIGIIGLVRGDLTLAAGVLCLLCVVYGFRLGGFLFIRELRSAAYRKTLNAQMEKPVPFPVKLVMWLFMAVLYVVQVSPIWYRESTAPAEPTGIAWVGALIMACGISIEALADKQKSDAKKKDPNKPAMTGLYKYSRCPNYFGEILFWTGVFVSSLNILKGAQWIVALIGYIAIFCIMISGAQRLEKRQNKNYGKMKEYRAYADKTPILIPFIPVYHFVKNEE